MFKSHNLIISKDQKFFHGGKRVLETQKNIIETNNPKLSIITVVLNGEKHLEDTIKSVLNQSYKNWELIFWDNCSNDKSSTILKSFKDSRIKYFKSSSLRIR